MKTHLVALIILYAHLSSCSLYNNSVSMYDRETYSDKLNKVCGEKVVFELGKTSTLVSCFSYDSDKGLFYKRSLQDRLEDNTGNYLTNCEVVNEKYVWRKPEKYINPELENL